MLKWNINKEKWVDRKQINVGSQVRFYVNDLNFLKYNFGTVSSTITIDPGDEGMFATFKEAASSWMKISPTGGKESS